ncbi:hypothetical protein EV197_0359 [Aquimarina brevivitae]|uniref:Uncharacterized protein n=2 Tax=Aquimarina brevivitae TaxID=323412 RepID=A0A4Q7PFC1_9FLAO|nr:hypothetical protein EV197_0359 [Aquimarina brevivitae]
MATKLKLFFRNDFESYRVKSWLVVLTTYVLAAFFIYGFKNYSSSILMLCFFVLSIVNSHSIEQKSWLDSCFLHSIFGNKKLSIGINVLSDFILKLILSIPFIISLIIFSTNEEAVLSVITIVLHILLSFFITEMAYKDLTYKKRNKVLIFFYMAFLIFFCSGAIDTTAFTVDESYVLLDFLSRNSMKILLIILLIHSISLPLFFNHYYNFSFIKISKND